MKKFILILFVIFIHLFCASTETTENDDRQNDVEANFTQDSSTGVDQCTISDPSGAALQTEREKSLYYYASSEKYKAMYNKALQREQMFANELRKERENYVRSMSEKKCMRDSIDEMQRALNTYKQRESESEARIADYKNFIGKFKALIEDNTLDVKIIDGRMVVIMSTDVLFASGSKKLSSKGKKSILEITKILKGVSDKRFQIEGHTDSDKYLVKGMTNWELALRALTVLHTMIANGMPSDRISAASFGSSKPVVENNSSTNKAKNRRIEIVVVPDLTLLPGFDELNKLSKE